MVVVTITTFSYSNSINRLSLFQLEAFFRPLSLPSVSFYFYVFSLFPASSCFFLHSIQYYQLRPYFLCYSRKLKALFSRRCCNVSLSYFITLVPFGNIFMHNIIKCECRNTGKKKRIHKKLKMIMVDVDSINFLQ